MMITEEQFRRIEGCFPKQRGNVAISNLDVLNAILHVAEDGCKWRALPKRFGRWHTIHTRLNRWAKAEVLDRVFTALQEEEIIRWSPGQRHDAPAGRELLRSLPPPEAPVSLIMDRALYRRRNEIERLFRRLKAFRRIFSRLDTLNVMFTGFIHFALIVEGLR